jgi:hypothetical protein
MPKREPVTAIKRQWVAWAKQRGLGVDTAGYCSPPEANLSWFSQATRAEFDAADGYAFALARKRSKISALHASAALAAPS